MTHGAEFFTAASQAAAALEQPTLMVSKDRSVLPDALPPNVRHITYAPFGWLFDRAAVLVHHGGIGTAGRALQAGLPQLIVPSGFDQFDNAARVARIGAGLELHRRNVTARSIEAAVRRLLTDADISERCSQVRAELAATDPMDEICSSIESLFGGR